jgi:uncharacterized membrane protein
MNTQTIVFITVTFFHNLFTAVWIGGLITLGFNLMPSMQKVLGKGPEMKKLMESVQKRQSVFVTVSIIGLALTGLLMTQRSPAGGAFFSFSSGYAALLSVKHILYLVMIVLAVLRSVMSDRPVKPGQPQKNTAALLMFANAGAGVLVLLLSSILAVMASVPVR